MKFPIIESHGLPSVFQTVFSGLNVREYTEPGEFSYMKNLTSDKYPYICPSAKKERVQFNTTFENIQAICPARDGTISSFSGVADGKFYYKGKNIPLKYSFMSMSAEDEITLVDCGGKIIIHPYMYSYEYDNDSTNSYVYPLNDGVYYKIIDVYCGNSSGDAQFTIVDGDDWGKVFTVGNYIDIWVADKVYAELCPDYMESKYDSRNTTQIVKAIITEINNNKMKVRFYNKYDVLRTPREANSRNPIDFEFDPGDLAIFKYIPPFSHICASKNRIWGVHLHGEGIFASAPGDFSSFYNFAGLATDSWYTEVDSSSKFNGICSFREYILAFKSNTIYQIYGNTGLNFSLAKQITNCGCITTICETGNSVYFLNYDGLYEYSGGLPYNISEKLNLKCESGFGFTDGKKIYLSVNDTDILYAFDITRRIWHVEDSVRIRHGFKLGNIIIYGTNSKMFKSTEEYSNSWEAQTADIYEDITQHKGINNIFLKLYNNENSWVEIFVSTNDEDFVSCSKITKPGDFTIRLPVRFKKADKYKIKLHGEGNTVVKGIERIVYVGGGAVTR